MLLVIYTQYQVVEQWNTDNEDVVKYVGSDHLASKLKIYDHKIIPSTSGEQNLKLWSHLIVLELLNHKVT